MVNASEMVGNGVDRCWRMMCVSEKYSLMLTNEVEIVDYTPGDGCCRVVLPSRLMNVTVLLCCGVVNDDSSGVVELH